MRVCLEATSLLGPRSGVGHTAAALSRALVEVDEQTEVVLLPISWRGAGRLGRAASDHPRITPLNARVPARIAQWVWARSTWPPAELFCGKVDVFHGPNFMLPPLLKAAGVVTIHDLAFERVPEMCSEHVRTYSDSVPRSARRANRIIVPSRFVAGEVAAWLPAEANRIRVVPPGVRDAFRRPGGPLTPPRAEALGVRPPYVAFLGNLERRKNLDGLLTALELVRVRREDVQLVLLGSEGVGWNEIAERHEKLLGTKAVARLGYLPDGEVAALIRGAAAFVYPSLYEGFGMPVIEAMACRTPVIAARTSSLPESGGGHAQLVEPEDPHALAEAIEQTIAEPPDDEALDAARAWADGFTWTAAATRTLAVYAEAVDEVQAA